MIAAELSGLAFLCSCIATLVNHPRCFQRIVTEHTFSANRSTSISGSSPKRLMTVNAKVRKLKSSVSNAINSEMFINLILRGQSA